MNSIISVTNCSLLLHLLVLLSPWSFASFIAEASAAVNVSAARLKSPFKIVSWILFVLDFLPGLSKEQCAHGFKFRLDRGNFK